ncbi:unnamed protein product [Polarella glacialis]|uniref:Uncharacterized protein n=1 Tax=Polarella glacialis TaxID=89957 RepID=A0A813IZL0_POLGL|nr:unnamed protein product [Polarella glacialis]
MVEDPQGERAGNGSDGNHIRDLPGMLEVMPPRRDDSKESFSLNTSDGFDAGSPSLRTKDVSALPLSPGCCDALQRELPPEEQFKRSMQHLVSLTVHMQQSLNQASRARWTCNTCPVSPESNAHSCQHEGVAESARNEAGPKVMKQVSPQPRSPRYDLGTPCQTLNLQNPKTLLSVMTREPSIRETFEEHAPAPQLIAAPAMTLGSPLECAAAPAVADRHSRRKHTRSQGQDRVVGEDLIGVLPDPPGLAPGHSPGRSEKSWMPSVASIRSTRRNLMVSAIAGPKTSVECDQDLEGNDDDDDDDDESLELAMQYDESCPSLLAQRIGAFAHLALKLCGVFPLCNFSRGDSVDTVGGNVEVPRRFCMRVALSGSYRALLLLTDVCFLCSTANKLRSGLALVHDKELDDCHQLAHPLVTDLVVAAGAVLTILACGMPYCEAWGRGRQIRRCRDALETISARTHCEVEWTRAHSWDALTLLLTWLLLVGARFGADIYLHLTLLTSSTSWDAIHFGLFVVASARVAAAGLLVVYLSRSMSLAINGFERKFVRLLESPRAPQAFSAARLEWNKFSAAFRNTSVSLQWCFALLAGTAVLSTVAALLDAWMYSLRVVLPGIVLSLTSLRVLLSAGATTDYCVKLPSLFTTVRTSSPQLEKGLLRLVQFLHATEAGFYVSETKISSSGILKGAYVTAIAVAALATELLRL